MGYEQMENTKESGRSSICIYLQNAGEAPDGMEAFMFVDMLSSGRNIKVVQEDAGDRIAEFFARRKIQKLTAGKAGLLLLNRYKLGRVLEELAPQYDDVYVFCFNFAFLMVRHPVSVLKAYQKKWPNIKYIIHYADTVCRPVAEYANYLRENGVFDLVYSFDPKDSEDYNFLFWKTPYSSVAEYHQIQPEKDLYFVGYGLQREKQLAQIAAMAREHEVNAQLDVMEKGNTIPYSEALKRTMEAKCILEVMRPNQKGMSLRYYEAVTYNRKLLTNNPTVFSFPYYDARFMQYFETPEEIDWDWVKADTHVEYHYKNDFSPINLVEDFQKRLYPEQGNDQ